MRPMHSNRIRNKMLDLKQYELKEQKLNLFNSLSRMAFETEPQTRINV